MNDLKLDQSIEVTKEQYDFLRDRFRGLIAHREEAGKYYVKAWDKRALNYIKDNIKPVSNEG